VLKITNSLENKTASNNNQLNAKREFKNELKPNAINVNKCAINRNVNESNAINIL